VVNGKLKCADHIFLRRVPARRPVGDGYGFPFFRLMYLSPVFLAREEYVAPSYALLSASPLDGSIPYATQPPTHNTRIRSPFLQLTAVNHYMSRPFYRVASLSYPTPAVPAPPLSSILIPSG